MKYMCVTPKRIFLQLNNLLRFRLSRVKEIENFFIAGISDRKKVSRTLSKYIT